jgi:hypothetical protein
MNMARCQDDEKLNTSHSYYFFQGAGAEKGLLSALAE